MESNEEYYKYLFLRNITQTLSPSEEEELETLLKDEKIKREYNEFVQLFPAADVSTSFSRLDNPEFWNSHLPHPIYRQRVKKRRILIFKRSLMAAAVVGVIFMGWTLFKPEPKPAMPLAAEKQRSIQLTLANGEVIDLLKEKGNISRGGSEIFNDSAALTYSSNTENYGMNSVVVPVGMDYQLNLSDGSTIWMNSDTKLEFPSKFARNKREITLSGEAYLDIAKNPSLPFIVRLAHATVEVTGTEFNVNTYDTTLTKVSLVEGGVNLLSGSGVVKITPGSQGVYDTRMQKAFTEPFAAKKTLSWRKGIFFFDAASLNEISPVLWRWFGVKTKVDNPDLLNKKFVGVLNKDESIEIFLDNLKAISEIEGYFDKDGVLHFK